MSAARASATTFVVALAVGFAAPAHALERVLVLEPPEQARPGLVAAVQIQLSGVAEVVPVEGAEPTGAGVEAQVRAAGELANRRDALLVVWVEGEADAPRVLAYIVGRRAGRALLEIVEVPGGHGPDVDRSVALKVRDVVDSMLRARAAPAAEPALLDAPGPAAEPVPPPWRWGTGLELTAAGGTLAGADAGQWGGVLGVGPSLAGPAARFEVLARLRVMPAVSLESEGEKLELGEIDPGLLVSARALGAGWEAGLSLGGLWRLLDARGQGAGGTRRDVGESMVSLLAAAEGRVQLLGPARLLLRVGAEWMPHRQAFVVNAERLADLGHVRPFVELGLAVGL